MAQHLIHQTRIVASIETVFETVADASRAPEWIPSLIEVTDIRGRGQDTTYNWVFKMAGVALRGHSRITHFTRNQIVEVRTGGMVDSTWIYVFDEEDHHTRLRVEVQYETPEEVQGRVGEELLQRMHQRELETSLANLKDLIELSIDRAAA